MSALLVERPDVATVTVTGSDRLAWLQGIVTCDVSTLAPGGGRWGLALSKQGKILAELWILARSEACLLGIAGGSTQALLDWLDSFIIMEDVELSDDSASNLWFMLHGPLAESTGAELSREHSAWTSGGIDWTRHAGAALSGPRSDAAAIRDAILARGFELAEQAAWDRLRIGSLVPQYGVDYDQSRNPHEASLDRRAVSWDKGCYLGQEAVCMQDMRGKVKRRLVTVSIDATGIAPGAPVEDAESHDEVGTVTSVTPNDVGSAALAIASVKAGYAEVGRALVVAEAAARVVVAPPGNQGT